MKVVLWAGGLGSRISEESHLVPKPMIEIGGMPILWHIMKLYSHYGHNEFVICLGYKQYVVKEFFKNYILHRSDVTFDMKENKMHIHSGHAEPWKVTLVDTGMNVGKAGRLRRVKDYINDETFAVAYGDNVSNVNINEVIKFHQSHGKIATVTAVNVAQSKGVLNMNTNGSINSFGEKQQQDATVVNGGFMVLNRKVFSYVEKVDDEVEFEDEPMRDLLADGELMAYYHSGFWQCMDTQREKMLLEKMWNEGDAPWKVW